MSDAVSLSILNAGVENATKSLAWRRSGEHGRMNDCRSYARLTLIFPRRGWRIRPVVTLLCASRTSELWSLQLCLSNCLFQRCFSEQAKSSISMDHLRLPEYLFVVHPTGDFEWEATLISILVRVSSYSATLRSLLSGYINPHENAEGNHGASRCSSTPSDVSKSLSQPLSQRSETDR
jgi:hypothetical protein